METINNIGTILQGLVIGLFALGLIWLVVVEMTIKPILKK